MFIDPTNNSLIQKLKDILEDLHFQTQLGKSNISLNENVFEYSYILKLLKTDQHKSLSQVLPKNIMLLEEICSTLYLGSNIIDIQQLKYNLIDLEKELYIG